MIFVKGVKDNHFDVGQVMTSPSVYLDHCILRNISQDTELADRLIAAVKKSNGTLVISDLNIQEFFGVTATSQAIAAERVIASVSPQIFFMDVDLLLVAEREAALHPTARTSVCADKVQILDNIGRATPLDTGVFVWPQGSMFAVSQEIRDKNVTQQQQAIAAGRTFMKSFRQVRQSTEYKQNKKDQAKAFREKWPTGGRSTRAVLSILFEKFDQSIPSPNDNDFFDFLHACVPTSYCDYVVFG